MKPVVTVAFLVFGLGFLGAAMWLGNQAAPPADASSETPPAPKPALKVENPEISPTGPYPKAVALEKEFDFGALLHGSESSHDYVIKNQGEAPLILKIGHITCNCTGAVLANADPAEPGQEPGKKATVKPGEETAVTLSWKIKDPNPSFRHSAKILTNDPENQEIELVVKGKTEKGLLYDPPGLVWDLGEAVDQTVMESHKALYSGAIESFQVVELVPSNPRVKCTAEPMDAAALEKYEAKCGYMLHLTVDVADITGNLNEQVTIKTDLPNDVGGNLPVRVRKQGPIEVIARNWNAEQSRISLGEFQAKDGRQIELNVFTRVPEEVGLVSAESEHKTIQFHWEKDQDYKGKSKNIRRYRLKVEVPPGQGTANRRQDQAERVNLKFDHPQIGTLKVVVDYLSY